MEMRFIKQDQGHITTYHSKNIIKKKATKTFRNYIV